ncbi:uncharacterized protein [Ambystoma mexicanum]|uniref:uncharacterized protein n=1 Tax=Ambystoma mexicanum TaxID=8296 RepID=UPI0037E7EADC
MITDVGKGASSEMTPPLRKWFILLTAMVLTLLLIGYVTKLHHLVKVVPSFEPRSCFQKGKVAKGIITKLNGIRTFITAAYYDNRHANLIRAIGIIPHEEQKDLYCWFHCRSDDGRLETSKALVDIHSDWFGFPYGTADLICHEPEDCDPKYVSFHWSEDGDCTQISMFEIRNRHPEALSAEFTVCLSTMFGQYNNVLLFIQSVEMYKLLGVKRVMIYKSDVSQYMERVLQHYISEGTIEIIPWKITSFLKVSKRWHYNMSHADIGYYGQLTALNDCIYRNMYRTKYLMLHDIDEIVLPIRHPNWSTMMADLSKQRPDIGVFMFENYVFRFDVFDTTFNMSIWKTIPGTNILQHIHREPHIGEMKYKGRKMVINPRKAIQTSVHKVLKTSGPTFSVPPHIGILYHCRKQYQANLSIQSLIRDTTIWKYSAPLIQRVNTVLKEL